MWANLRANLRVCLLGSLLVTGLVGCAIPAQDAPALLSRAEIDALALRATTRPDTGPIESRADRLRARAEAMRRHRMDSIAPSQALLTARADQLAMR